MQLYTPVYPNQFLRQMTQNKILKTFPTKDKQFFETNWIVSMNSISECAEFPISANGFVSLLDGEQKV